MNFKRSVSAAFLYVVMAFVPCLSWALPWPGEPWQQSVNLTSLDDVNANNPQNNFVSNLSGAHWNSQTRTLWVCVNGPGKFMAIVEDGAGSFRIDQQNGQRGEFSPNGDLEGITQADFDEDSVYLIDESNNTIKKYHTSSYGVSRLLQSWNITANLPQYDGTFGPEGITFVPDFWLEANGFVDRNGSPYVSQNGMGGLMFIAHQNGGGVYVFDLNPNNNTFSFVGKYLTSRGESSGLEFDRSSGKLYIWHNTNGNKIEVTDMTSTPTAVANERRFRTVTEIDSPKDGNLEGFAMTPASAEENWAFFTDDSNQNGYALMWFRNFVPDVLGPDFYEMLSSDSLLEVSVEEGLLKNDKGRSNTVVLVAGPAHGELRNLSAGDIFDGSFEYIPDEGFSGTDFFTYKANNGIANSETVKVSIEVPADVPENSFVTQARVSASADDVEETFFGGIDSRSPDLSLVQDISLQSVGIRFNSIQVPVGAVITRAYIQFAAGEVSQGEADLLIQAEARSHSMPFKSRWMNLSGRPKTLASVDWGPAPWNLIGEAAEHQQTSDLTSVVQEIINLPDWQQGNSVSFIITGEGRRVAKSYDGDPNLAPLLHIEYDFEANQPDLQVGEDLPPEPGIQIVQPIQASADDAEEASNGVVNLTSTDLELIQENSTQKVGLRFVGLNIPRGAQILRAYVQFGVDETVNQAANLVIWGQNVANAPAFVAQNNNISVRVRTAAQVPWVPNVWNVVGAAGVDQQTPDLSSVVQEIVGRADWAPGNALALIVTGQGKRVAESYDGDPALAPLLFVEYR